MKSENRLKPKFFFRFILITIGVGLLLGLANNLTNSILFNILKWKGSSFQILSMLVGVFYSCLTIYISTRLTIKSVFDKGLFYEEEIKSFSKFLISFFIALIGITIIFQIIFYNKNVSKLAENYNSFSTFVSKDMINNRFEEAKRFYLWMNVIQVSLTSVFLILMMPISRKRLPEGYLDEEWEG